MKKSLLLIFLATIVFAGCSIQGTKSVSRATTFYDNQDSSIITCDLYLENTITSRSDTNWMYNIIETATNKQKSPLTLTFVWLNTEEPQMKWNIDTVSLLKIDNGDTIYLVETTAIGNMSLYTYFPKEKIMIMSKQYNLLWTLYWWQMMWFCK